MKLKNKFIPLVTLVATTSVVAPLSVTLTSCSSWIRMYDVSEGPFQPDVAPLDEHDWGVIPATEAYMSECQHNPRAFIQDVMCGQSTWIHDALNYTFPESKIEEFNIGVSKPSFGWTTAFALGTEDWQYPIISFDQKINLKISNERLDDDTGETVNKILSLEVNVSYKNVVFYAVTGYSGTGDLGGSFNIGMFDNGTNVSPSGFDESYWPYMFNTTPWSIDYDIKFSEVTKITNQSTGDIRTSENVSNAGDSINDLYKLSQLKQLWWNNPSLDNYYRDIAMSLASRYIVFNYPSNLLSKITPSIDARQTSLLSGICYTGRLERDETYPIGLRGISFLNYPDDINWRDEDILGYYTTTITLCDESKNPIENLTLTQDESSMYDEQEEPATITICPDDYKSYCEERFEGRADLMLMADASGCKGKYKIDPDTNSAILTFSLPSTQYYFNIEYVIRDSSSGEIKETKHIADIPCYLNYSHLSLTIRDGQ